MTNGKKYLKDGVDKKEFAIAIAKRQVWWSSDAKEHFAGIVNDIIMFLDEEAKPTLTEDERVILRSFDKQLINYISRDTDNNITVSYKPIEEEINNAFWELTFYNHKFQFIKERRRILY